PRSSWISMMTEYSQGVSVPGCRMVPSTLRGHTVAGAGRATVTASKRRWRWHAGQVAALRRIRSPQCGQFQASPVAAARGLIGWPPAMRHRAAARDRLSSGWQDAAGVGRRPRVQLALLPAEFHLPAHLRAGGHREAARLQVADERPGLLELDAALGDDVPAH